ncbi:MULTISPECIES: putative T6SS immunity periplasmic lipoprotein [unclassified Cedecea]|uniref:putative T6SS immunity periplasmic lipoprotein n=1 Tax=unclassified Cedecea TaxID=2649846 RepID=UPI003015AE43
MNRLFKLIFLCTALSGCVGEGLGVGDWKSLYIDGNHICFTVDKSDVLTRYVLSSTQGGEYKVLAVTDLDNLSYPNTCINIELTPGYIYQASYTMNKANYRYSFFIDNDRQIIELGCGK